MNTKIIIWATVIVLLHTRCVFVAEMLTERHYKVPTLAQMQEEYQKNRTVYDSIATVGKALIEMDKVGCLDNLYSGSDPKFSFGYDFRTKGEAFCRRYVDSLVTSKDYVSLYKKLYNLEQKVGLGVTERSYIDKDKYIFYYKLVYKNFKDRRCAEFIFKDGPISEGEEKVAEGVYTNRSIYAKKGRQSCNMY